MTNYKMKPDMVMKTLEEQATAIEVLRRVITGIRRVKFENKVDSKELLNVLSGNCTQTIINKDLLAFVYEKVTVEQLEMLCDYFETELIFNNWKLESVFIEDANGKKEKYWFDIGVVKDGMSMVASFRNDILAIVKVR